MSTQYPGWSWFKFRRRMVGIVFLLVFAMLIWLSISLYDKRFTPVVLVNLDTDTVGNELHQHADVKVHGVLVGEVRQISSTGDGARLLLAIQPDKVAALPANVSARLLPKTLFGERYVDLVLPAVPVSARLAAGSEINQDHSSSAIELERVLSDLMPVLQAVQPQKLSVTLTAISQALQGRGTELGQTLVLVGRYLKQFNPQLPTLDTDIRELVGFANSYDQAAPNLVSALSNLTTTSKTIAQQRDQLSALYATVTGSAQDLATFLSTNQNNLIRLAADSRSTLELLGRYSAEFPCVLQELTAFEPEMDKVLGKGTNQPGLHATVNVVRSLGKYQAGVDTPTFGDTSGPHCYPTPFTGARLNDGASPPAAPQASQVPSGTRLANSTQENEFLNELLSPSLNLAPTALPGWTSLLVGPLFRGTEVTLK